MKRIASEIVYTVDLEHEQLWVLQDRCGARVRVLSGGLWLTEEGQPEDRFVQPGEELRLNAPGRALLEGRGPSRIELIDPPRRFAQQLRERFAAVFDNRSLRVRSLAGAISIVLALGVPEWVARGFHGSARAAGLEATAASDWAGASSASVSEGSPRLGATRRRGVLLAGSMVS